MMFLNKIYKKLKCVIAFVFSLYLYSCGSGYDKYTEYDFYEFKKNNELINHIKSFKENHPEYDVFHTDSHFNRTSIDSVYFNGLYNVYIVDFYLPKTAKRVGCVVILQDDTSEKPQNILYLCGYVTPDSPQGDKYAATQFTKFPRSNLSKEEICMKTELEEILKQIGKYK